MQKTTISNLGSISIENLEVNNGQIEVFIPVEAVSDELDAVLEKCTEDFRKQHPEVKVPCFNLRLVFSFGYANPEFELLILMYDDTSDGKYEVYDHILTGELELSEEQKKQIKKVMWEKLGEALFNL